MLEDLDECVSLASNNVLVEKVFITTMWSVQATKTKRNCAHAKENMQKWIWMDHEERGKA